MILNFNMKRLHLPDNIKIHYAGAEVCGQYAALQKLGINYSLYTAYPFVALKFFKKKVSPIIPMKWMTAPAIEIPQLITNDMRHTIQDSGLFSLMFGSQKDNIKPSDIYTWYDLLVEYTLEHKCNVACVEVDCQKILGAKQAWDLRKKMSKDLPNNRIINVFHIEDGKKGLDRLIEYSDYISIGVPELRSVGLSHYVPTIARYIKEKKPNIDIHLLGCTDLKMITQCNFCTSCDSTSWKSSLRYGRLEERKVSEILIDKVKDFVGEEKWNFIRQYSNELNTASLCLNIELLKRLYESAVGNQDYVNRF